MMDCYYEIAARSSYEDSLKVLEADIQHANALAVSIPRGKGCSYLQMKLVYNHLAPIFLLLLQWMDCSCSCLLSSSLNLFHVVVYQVCSDGKPKISACRRKATIKEFYAVILPSLQRLHGDSMSLDTTQENKYSVADTRNFSDMEREDECGICLEPCTKMVVPNCCHAMCINCYHDWFKHKSTLFPLAQVSDKAQSLLNSLQEHKVRILPVLQGKFKESELG